MMSRYMDIDKYSREESKQQLIDWNSLCHIFNLIEKIQTDVFHEIYEQLIWYNSE